MTSTPQRRRDRRRRRTTRCGCASSRRSRCSGWLLGPVALLGFAVLGLVGYSRACRAGLTRSKCFLRDTRLVIGYLALLAAAGVAGIVVWVV